MMRYLVVVVGMFLLGTLTPVGADDLDWEKVNVAKDGQLEINVRFKKKASFADTQWLAIEFDNRSDEDINIKNARYRIESERFDIATEKPKSSGSLASGNEYDLFPHAWKSAPVADRIVKPGIYRMIDHPSLYSSALLGQPSKDGILVKATIHVSIEVNGKQTSSDAQFEFQWLHLGEKGTAQMQTRLKSMLKNPRDVVQHAYILNAHLRIPGVSQAVTSEELIKALPQRTQAFSGRGYILEHINQNHAKDPSVIAYFHKRLKAADKLIADDLRQLPDIWHDDFLEPLVVLIEGDDKELHNAFAVLGLHESPQKNDPQLARRLSAALTQKGFLDGLKFETDGQAALASINLRLYGKTHDRDIIPKLAPLLDNKTQICDPKRLSFASAFDNPDLPALPPLRVCDHALEAILTILDGEPNEAYKAAGVISLKEFRIGAEIDELSRATSEMRDKMIVTLEKRLQK